MIYHAARLIILTSFIGYTRDNLSAAAPLLKDIDHKIEKVDNFLGYWKLKLQIKDTPNTHLNKVISSCTVSLNADLKHLNSRVI